MHNRIDRFSRESLTREERDINLWPMVDLGSMDPASRELYERRYQSIAGYLRGERLAALKEKTGLDRFEVHRLLGRCLKSCPLDNRIWGCRALVSGIHVVKYHRLSDMKAGLKPRCGKAGLLARLFDRFPMIRENVVSNYLLKRPHVNESRGAIDTTHSYFIKLCREAEIARHEYPFNTRYLGLRSLGLFLRKIGNQNLEEHVAGNHGEEAARLLRTGTGIRAPRIILLPYQRAFFDGHRIDGIFMVTIHNPDGEDYELVLDRPWLLVVQDVTTRAVLGWHLCLNPEYTKDDVLKCVRNAIEPWKRRELTVQGLTYNPGGGMPSEVLPALHWAVWSELSYDGAKANIAEWVRAQITSAVGAGVNPGPAGCPEDRGVIEALFRVLEGCSFHRLPNTTGGHPRDPARKEPERAALKYKLSLNHLLDLVSVELANLNDTPHSILNWATPLERLRYLIEDKEVVIRHLEPENRQKIGLLNMRITRIVRGDIKKGRRPYVQFFDERYSNQVLARQPDLIGTELVLVVDTEDLGSIRAFLPSGAELGILTALGKWSHTKHGLATRKAANSRRIRRLHHKVDNVDPVQALLGHLRESAPKDRRALGKYVTVAHEAGLPENFAPAPPIATKSAATPAREPEVPTEELTESRRVMLY